jgi:opacity protein-like surface antigen
MIAIFVLAAASHAHSQIIHVDGGVHGAALTRQGEGRDGTTGGYGGWMNIGGEQFRLDVDSTRSTTLRRVGIACVDPLCRRSALNTSFQREWMFGVAGLWRFRTTAPVTPHVLVGIGRLERTVCYDFSDPAIPDVGPWRSAHGMLFGGAGLDFPAESRFSGRVQYRFNLSSVEDTIHEFRVGAGLRF